MFKVFLKCFNWVIALNLHNFERKYFVLKEDSHQGCALVFDCLGVVLSFKVLQEKRARQPWDLRHLLESERYFSFVSFQLRLMATWHFSFKRRKCFTLWAITRKIELSAFLSLDAKLCWHFEALFFAGKNSLFLLLELQNRKTNIRIWMLAPLSWANILWPILFFGKILQNKICPENLKCFSYFLGYCVCKSIISSSNWDKCWQCIVFVIIMWIHQHEISCSSFSSSETIVLQYFSSKMKKVEKSKLACDQLEDWQSVSEVESSRVIGETPLLTKKSRHNKEDMFWIMVSVSLCLCVSVCLSVFLCVFVSVCSTKLRSVYKVQASPLPRRKHLHICFETKEHSAARTLPVTRVSNRYV